MSANQGGGRGRGWDRGGGRDAARGRGGTALPFQPRGRGLGGHPSQPEGQYHQDRSRSDRGRGRGAFGRGRGGPVEVEVFNPAGGVPKPEPGVRRVEEETENAFKLLRTKSASQKTKASLEPGLPQRPGFGTRGKEVVLWTNYFNMMAYGELLLHRYSIEVVGDSASRNPTGKKLRRVVQLFLEEHLAQYGHDVATDFKSNLLSKTALELEEEYAVTYRVEDEDDPAPNAKVYRVRVRPTGMLTVSELMDHLTSAHTTQLFGSKEEIIQALDIVVGHYPKAAAYIASIGANRHFRLDAATSEKFDLGAGLTALRGFFVSVRAATARILVNVQVKHVAFYDDGPLDRLIHAFRVPNGPNKVRLWNFLKKLSVDVTHIVKLNNAGKRIPRLKQLNGFATRDDGRGQEHPPRVLDFGAGSKEVEFFWSDSPVSPSGKPQGPSGTSGKKGKGKGKGKSNAPAGPSSSQGQYISVFDYFKRNYPHITIKDPSLPVVNVGDRQNPKYLPPDVCVVLPGQPSRTKLTASQTQQMIRFAVRKPAHNAQSIATAGASMLGFDPNNPTIDAFGLNVVPKLITVPGRVLSSPDIKYHGDKVANPRFGGWNMANSQFATRVDLSNWTYLWISVQGSNDPWHDDGALKGTLDAFTATLRNVGINATNCIRGMHITVNGDPEAAIDNAIRRFSSTPGIQPPKLVLVILPSADSTIYNRVKYACDVKGGIVNVCVVASKFSRANPQYYANVALKVNLKLGGRNQFLDTSKLGIIAENKTMVVGIDVTHPAPGSSARSPSVASIVASVDQWLAQWPAELRIQTGRQEMVADLEGLFKSRLRLWKAKHNVYPVNVLIYRDGVSEGQYNIVLEQELPALRKACEELYPASSIKQGIPRTTIVIVGKRHNTRFYPTKKEDADRSSNPQNGTIVDRGVTEARNWDFFLQAHAAVQGTARPAHYYIVFDEIFQAQKVLPPFTNVADMMEDLTHNLCYMFGRATKAVSICPPAYYADLACERARC